MNRVLASFTSSERNLITFVLLVVAGGYALLEWRGEQQSTLVFTAKPTASSENGFAAKDILPKGMDATGRIDVNTADKKLLETMPGIGPAMAGALLRFREKNGPFTSMADLDAVPGIGPAMMTKLSPLVSFGDAVAIAPAPAPPAVAASPVYPDIAVNALAPVAPPRQTVNEKVNINTADAAKLDTLKGIGPALARRILQDRQRGPFRGVEDLKRVKGIGPKILRENRDKIVAY